MILLWLINVWVLFLFVIKFKYFWWYFCLIFCKLWNLFGNGCNDLVSSVNFFVLIDNLLVFVLNIIFLILMILFKLVFFYKLNLLLLIWFLWM